MAWFDRSGASRTKSVSSVREASTWSADRGDADQTLDLGSIPTKCRCGCQQGPRGSARIRLDIIRRGHSWFIQTYSTLFGTSITMRAPLASASVCNAALHGERGPRIYPAMAHPGPIRSVVLSIRLPRRRQANTRARNRSREAHQVGLARLHDQIACGGLLRLIRRPQARRDEEHRQQTVDPL